MNSKKLVLSVLAASIFGGLVSVGTYHYFSANYLKQQYQEAASITEKNQVLFASNQGVVNTAADFRQAAAVSTSGVVHIKTFQNESQSYHRRSPMDDFFHEFFGDPRYGNPRIEQGPRRLGSGSGVILTGDGYIATNNHVIKGADKIAVVLYDKREFEAELIGTDPTTDLALLKIDSEELPFIRYGNSDDLEVGEWVLAVGNPFELTSTATAGIVSAKARNINILRGKENLAIESFIQTDAAVNPGNSGGALVNLKGELIGINTAIATPTGTYAGYAFAVPVTIVQKVMDDLVKYGQVQRALLGVSIRDIDATLAEEKELKEVRGVYIAGVREGSSAQDAGIETNDIVLEINGVAVNSSSELQEQIARFRPGDDVTITYLRDGKEMKSKAKLKNKLGTTEVVKKGEKAIVQVMGMHLQELNDEEKESLGVKGGVKVVQLGKGKLKEQKMEEGFVILYVDKQRVSTPEQVAYLMQDSHKGASLLEGVYPSGERGVYIAGW